MCLIIPGVGAYIKQYLSLNVRLSEEKNNHLKLKIISSYRKKKKKIILHVETRGFRQLYYLSIFTVSGFYVLSISECR